MVNEKFWQVPEVKALVEFLTNGVGDDHDSAVYDTKFEFDRHNPEAVRYMVTRVLNRNRIVVKDKVWSGFYFEYPCPEDGSVLSINTEVKEWYPQYEDYAARKKREQECEWVYVPDQDKYCELVLAAVTNDSVYTASLSDEEANRGERQIWKVVIIGYIIFILIIVLKRYVFN